MSANDEHEYFKQELHQIIRTRYGKLTVAQTVGILEMVKWELINLTPTQDDDER
jgi:hypothetical protein